MFETEQHEQLRFAVVDLFNRYKRNREELQKSWGQQDSLSEEELNKLTKNVASLEASKYLLAVIGESKSGKSAFINGLIKKPLLPTGILQCTSGIIEVVDTYNEHDERGKLYLYLTIKYGDYREENQISKDGNIASIQEKLRKIASLPDEYRSLPVGKLNDYLIEKNQRQITDQDIETLLESIYNPQDNSHNLPREEFTDLVKGYLEKYRDLSKIATQITIGCPLGFKFTDLRIVDTPGVNARGGIQQTTVKYVRDANAAVVIHPIKNIASESLDKFFRETAKDDIENVFMVLTHRAQSKAGDVEIAIEQARKIFSDVKPERVVAVDSMLKRIYDEMATGTQIEELVKDEEIEQLIAKYILRHGNDVQKIQQSILEDSNFPSMEKLLRDFSEQALDQQLRSIIKQIAIGYEEQKSIYEQEIASRNSKATKRPEEFDHEINTLKRVLDDYRKILTEFSESKCKEYTSLHSSVVTEIKVLRDSSQASVKASRSSEEVYKHVTDFEAACDKKVIFYTTQLSVAYETQMAEVGVEFKRQHLITPPRISFEGIASKAKERSFETIDIPGNRRNNALGTALAGGVTGAITGAGATALNPVGILIGALIGAAAGGAKGFSEGTPSKKDTQFNDRKYVEILKGDVVPAIGRASDAMSGVIRELFKEYDETFQERLGDIVSERQKAYEILRTKKEEAEELYRDVERLSSMLQVVSEELQRVDDIKKKIPLEL
jgi:hypothetical protein